MIHESFDQFSFEQEEMACSPRENGLPWMLIQSLFFEPNSVDFGSKHMEKSLRTISK
jgi:hypothetical protein